MVKIISDSTCDLTKDLVQKYDISLLPLHILLGGEEYLDGVDITPQEIFNWSDRNKTTPKTSAPALEAAVALLEPYVQEQREVVCFSISDSMSASGNIMRMAARELKAEHLITVVDSQSLCAGIGLLAIEAAVMAKEGKDAATIVKRMMELRPRVRASFVVDTLVYLYRGGRCSGLAAMAGSALKLHPRIVLENGKMGPGKKYRGNINKVIMSYVMDMEEEMKNADKSRIMIANASCDREVVDRVLDYLKSLNHFEEVIEVKAGGVISSHCGPGTMGVFFIS